MVSTVWRLSPERGKAPLQQERTHSLHLSKICFLFFFLCFLSYFYLTTVLCQILQNFQCVHGDLIHSHLVGVTGSYETVITLNCKYIASELMVYI